MRKGAALVTAMLALAGALGATSSAEAATTCTFDPTFHVLSVNMDSDGDSTLLAVSPVSTDIQVRGQGPVLSCAGGSPTTANTDSIQVVDGSADGSTRVSIIDPDKFRDGSTPLNFIINLNGGNFDALQVGGSDATPDHYVLGNGGLNLNADVSSSANVLTSTLDDISLGVGLGGGTISAQGGAGTGAPYNRAGTNLALAGSSGDDTLEGSENGDLIQGHGGNDTLRGFGGNDGLVPGRGNDVVEGGAGSDTLGYYDIVTGGVNVSLATTGPQDTGAGSQTISGVENVDGTLQADKLTGNAGPNALTGGGGVGDVLEGGPGDDQLNGSGLETTIVYAHAPAGEVVDLLAKTVTGGDGTDTLQNIDDVIGSPFKDTIVGNANKNVVDGLGGEDTIATLAGADTIKARDGAADQVACGADTDSVQSDRRSLDAINADCENVDALPEPPAPPTTTTTDTGGGTTATGTGTGAAATTPTLTDTSLAFTLSAARVQRVLRTKSVALKAVCPDESCTAIAGAKGAKGAVKRLNGGTTTTLKLRLTSRELRSLRKALRRHKRAVVNVTVNAVDAAGSVVTRTVSVRVKR